MILLCNKIRSNDRTEITHKNNIKNITTAINKTKIKQNNKNTTTTAATADAQLCHAKINSSNKKISKNNNNRISAVQQK
jgi:hypothetical protein